MLASSPPTQKVKAKVKVVGRWEVGRQKLGINPVVFKIMITINMARGIKVKLKELH